MDSAQLDSIETPETDASRQLAMSGPPGPRIRARQPGSERNGLNGGGAVALERTRPLPRRPVEHSRREPRPGSFTLATKRAIDLVGSVLLLVLLSPALLVIAMLIKIDTPGPVLFRQRRIGRDGKAFSMLKFRTMVDGADAQKAALRHLNDAADGLFKIDGDPRVTTFGRWLRATSLDELPQLAHVVSGRMSLVGPRPLVPEEDARIRGPQRRRLRMRPGMTGVWQVNGASAIPIHEMVRLDAAYIDGWSLWLDVKVLAVTAAHVVMRKSM
jgi:lipopolysaccharide/colanic/teichoic acid biosynthesis glycosyltransferase